jgi:hypothetical protein
LSQTRLFSSKLELFFCLLLAQSFISSYLIENGICYLTLTEKSYPKRLAFLFLEEICREFEADLKAEYGDEWLRTVETVGRQYAFIKFGNVVFLSSKSISFYISFPFRSGYPKEKTRLF